MEVTRKIAGYVANASLEDFPPEALDVAKGGIIDCVACMLAGSREPLTDILCRFVRTTGGKLSSTVVGKGFKTSAPEAALVNAAAAHALDYDDITPPMKGHPSVVPCLPCWPLVRRNSREGKTSSWPIWWGLRWPVMWALP